MINVEAQKARRQFKTIFSEGSQNEPFADFLNDLGFGTIMTQAVLGALSLVKDESLITRFSNVETVAAVVGPLVAYQLFYERYSRMSPKKKDAVQRRITEVRHGQIFNPVLPNSS